MTPAIVPMSPKYMRLLTVVTLLCAVSSAPAANEPPVEPQFVSETEGTNTPPVAPLEPLLLLTTPTASSPLATSPRWHEDVAFRSRAFIAGSVLAVGLYGAVKWWDTGFNRNFRAQSEGWFGAGTEKGGADKLGHAFGAYTGVRAGTLALELLGNSREDAAMLALGTSLAIYTGIEVLDGLSKNYRFSTEDLVANFAGAGLGWLIHRYPALDALVDFRLFYRPSPEARADGKWEPFGGDYNGQRYLLAFKASGVPRLDANPVLRYAELVVGYGVRGYDPPGAERSRRVYAGVALNVSRVLEDTVFRQRGDSMVRKGTGMFLELFQLPGTVALGSRKL